MDTSEAIRTRSVRDEKPYKGVAPEIGISENTAILTTTCVRNRVRINRFSEVIYKTNRYSVPSKFAHRDAVIEIFQDRICIVVDTILVAEHGRTFGKHKAILNLAHFIDRLSFEHRGIVLAEVHRRRRFHHLLQSLLDGYVESNPASASKRFARVVALLEHYTMQEMFDAIEASTQSDTGDPTAIALTLKQRARSYDPGDNQLRVFDSEEWRRDRYNLHQEQFTPTEELLLSDID